MFPNPPPGSPGCLRGAQSFTNSEGGVRDRERKPSNIHAYPPGKFSPHNFGRSRTPAIFPKRFARRWDKKPNGGDNPRTTSLSIPPPPDNLLGVVTSRGEGTASVPHRWVDAPVVTVRLLGASPWGYRGPGGPPGKEGAGLAREVIENDVPRNRGEIRGAPTGRRPMKAENFPLGSRVRASGMRRRFQYYAQNKAMVGGKTNWSAGKSSPPPPMCPIC